MQLCLSNRAHLFLELLNSESSRHGIFISITDLPQHVLVFEALLCLLVKLK